MSGLGEIGGLPGVGGYTGLRATPDEIDRYEVVNTGVLSISSTWFGTAAAGTSTQAKAYVIINKFADHPRNALYAVAGSSDMGGTWAVNGKDQFGVTQSETVAIGTAANGATVAGTKIWRQIDSGTFTTATAALGNGTPKVGVAIGTAAGVAFKLGLLTKIGGSTDVVNIVWIKENVATTLNGGTIGSFVDATNHAFSGSAIMAGTEVYKALIRPTFDNASQSTNLSNI
jgi:hypothetical protein